MRTAYRNRDEITLGNCNGCTPMTINGHLCHEHFCPDAWRDETRECKECGTEFQPEDRRQSCCTPHCTAMYWGDYCGCDLCNEDRLAEEEDDE